MNPTLYVVLSFLFLIMTTLFLYWLLDRFFESSWMRKKVFCRLFPYYTEAYEKDLHEKDEPEEDLVVNVKKFVDDQPLDNICFVYLKEEAVPDGSYKRVSLTPEEEREVKRVIKRLIEKYL